jgi:hypothetical protein
MAAATKKEKKRRSLHLEAGASSRHINKTQAILFLRLSISMGQTLQLKTQLKCGGVQLWYQSKIE